jgi:hypothetical protein
MGFNRIGIVVVDLFDLPPHVVIAKVDRATVVVVVDEGGARCD